jgi:hypothetical protein
MSLTIETICAPSEDVVAREMEDELYTLNETGRAIWRRLDGTASLGLIAADLTAEYSAPAAEIERDVLGLAAELVRRKMLIVR